MLVAELCRQLASATKVAQFRAAPLCYFPPSQFHCCCSQMFTTIELGSVIPQPGMPELSTISFV